MAFAGGMLLRDRAWRGQRRATRRAGIADPTAAAAPHASKPFATTIEERRGVALNAIYIELSFEILAKSPEARDAEAVRLSDAEPLVWLPPTEASFDREGLDRFSFLGPGLLPAAEITAARAALEQYWGIVDSASCMRTILDLLEDGARGQFEYWCSVLAHHKLLDGSAPDIDALAESLASKFPSIRKADDSLSLRERLQLARDNWRLLHPGGTTAWDYARLVNVVILACGSGYLDNGQAWAIVRAVEAKARRSCRSWEQVADGFLIGRHLHFGVRRKDYDEAAKRLLTDNLSPWRTIPWDYSGPIETP
jgi:hypothetical protein